MPSAQRISVSTDYTPVMSTIIFSVLLWDNQSSFPTGVWGRKNAITSTHPLVIIYSSSCYHLLILLLSSTHPLVTIYSSSCYHLLILLLPSTHPLVIIYSSSCNSMLLTLNACQLFYKHIKLGVLFYIIHLSASHPLVFLCCSH